MSIQDKYILKAADVSGGLIGTWAGPIGVGWCSTIGKVSFDIDAMIGTGFSGLLSLAIVGAAIWIEGYTALMAFSVSALVDDGDWVAGRTGVGTIGSISIGILTAAAAATGGGVGSTVGTGTSFGSGTTGGMINAPGSSFTGTEGQTGGGCSIGSVFTGMAESPVFVRNRFGCLVALVDGVVVDSAVERRLAWLVTFAAGSTETSGTIDGSATFSLEVDPSTGLVVALTCWRLFEMVSFFAGRLPLANPFVAERALTGSGPSRRLAPIRSLSCIVSGLSVSSSLNGGCAAFAGGFKVFAFEAIESVFVGVAVWLFTAVDSLSSSISSSSFFDVSWLVDVSVDCVRIAVDGGVVAVDWRRWLANTMPNLLGVVGGMTSETAWMESRSVFVAVDGDSFAGEVMTMAGFSGVVGSGSTFSIGSSTGLALLFSPSVFSFFAGSLASSVDGRFCAALLLLMIFEIVLVVLIVGFFFSVVFVMEIFFFAAVCSSWVFDGGSFFGCSLFVFKIDFFTDALDSGSTFFFRLIDLLFSSLSSSSKMLLSKTRALFVLLFDDRSWSESDESSMKF